MNCPETWSHLDDKGTKSHHPVSVLPSTSGVKHAAFVRGKIDEILLVDRLRERDLRFVDLGRYLCEVRAGQYFAFGQMESFDDFHGGF